MVLSEEQTKAVEGVVAQKEAWSQLPTIQKRDLLVACRDILAASYSEWASITCDILGYKDEPKYAHLRGESYTLGPIIFGFWINGIIETYNFMVANGDKLPPPVSVSKNGDENHCLVFPRTFTDKIIAGGVSTELYIEKGKEVVQSHPKEYPAGLALILGAGNYSAPLDILSKMFITNHVVIYKPNPIYEKIVPVFRKIFQPLVSRGFLDFVVGGADVGSALLKLDSVDEIVLTGGKDTYNKIVWGGNPHSGTPNITKPICAELGSVNPVIVVPGVWTKAEMDAHCQVIAKAKLLNGSHVCASPQIILTSKEWPQREEFLETLKSWITKVPAKISYYPGTDQKYESHRSHATNSTVLENEKIFEKQKDVLFTSGASVDDFGLTSEAFCPVLYEVPLQATNVAEFLAAAVNVVNERCDGDLTAAILIDDKTAKLVPQALEDAISNLRAGCVGINQMAVAGIVFPFGTWGAYPGNSSQKIGSGTGQIGNCLGFKNVTKTVLRAPFIFVGQEKVLPPQAALKAAERAADYATYPSVFSLTKLVANSVIGL